LCGKIYSPSLPPLLFLVPLHRPFRRLRLIGYFQEVVAPTNLPSCRIGTSQLRIVYSKQGVLLSCYNGMTIDKMAEFSFPENEIFEACESDVPWRRINFRAPLRGSNHIRFRMTQVHSGNTTASDAETCSCGHFARGIRLTTQLNIWNSSQAEADHMHSASPVANYPSTTRLRHG
jgi:hypothetical protein